MDALRWVADALRWRCGTCVAKQGRADAARSVAGRAISIQKASAVPTRVEPSPRTAARPPTGDRPRRRFRVTNHRSPKRRSTHSRTDFGGTRTDGLKQLCAGMQGLRGILREAEKARSGPDDVARAEKGVGRREGTECPSLRVRDDRQPDLVRRVRPSETLPRDEVEVGSLTQCENRNAVSTRRGGTTDEGSLTWFPYSASMFEVPSTASNFSGTQPPASTKPVVSLARSFGENRLSDRKELQDVHVQPPVSETLCLVHVAVLLQRHPCEKARTKVNDGSSRSIRGSARRTCHNLAVHETGSTVSNLFTLSASRRERELTEAAMRRGSCSQGKRGELDGQATRKQSKG